MKELFYVLKVILKRLPYEKFINDEKEDVMNLNMPELVGEVHRYIAFYSDTETKNVLEGLEEFFRKYEEIFADKKSHKGISVFKAIFLCANQVLVIKNNEVLVRYSRFLRWRMLTQDLGEEIFVTAFRAEQDLERGRDCKDFDWPIVTGHNNTQLRNLTRQGMAENHFHLWGSAPYFYITWIWMMNHVEEVEKSEDFQWLSNDARTIYLVAGEEKFENNLKKACLQAALIRVYLCSILTRQQTNIGTYYVEHRLLFPWIEEIAEVAGVAKVAEIYLDGKHTIISNMDGLLTYVESSENLRKYSLGLHNIFTKRINFPESVMKGSFKELLKYALEKQGKIELGKCREIFSKEIYYELWNNYTQKKVQYYLENYNVMRAHIDEIQKAINEINCSKLKPNKIDYMLNYVSGNNDSLHRHNHILAGERKFLYDMFRFVKARKMKYSHRLYNWFYIYLAIKEKIRGEMVQSNEWIGFENFSIYQNRSGSFVKDKFLEQAKAHMAVASCFEQNVIKLEVRFSPYTTAKKICEEIRFLDAAIDPDKRFRDYYYYVLHFIKKIDGNQENGDNISCTARHSQLREEIRSKALAILKLREKYPDIADRVLGIDAAAQEIGCRPEIFAQAFRTLHEDTGYRYTKNGYKRIPQLKMTYHVGEDFLDVVDGLRAIDEAVLFLNMDCGDRLGHALALGVDVRKWYESKQYQISLTKQDYLDNIVWLYHAIIRYDIDGQDNFKNWLEAQYRRYFEEVYTRYMDSNYIEAIQKRMGKNGHKGNMNFDIHDYHDAWKIRGDDPQLYLNGYFYKDDSDRSPYKLHEINKVFPEDFFVRKRNEVVMLYHFYHYNADIRRAGKLKVEKRIEMQYIEAVELVQKKMRWEIAQRGIGIETNPSSNYMIGTFSRYDEHPITRFYNEGLTLDHEKLQDSSQIWVSINTDDQGVFDIKLENEYALMARALEKKKDENGNPVYSKTMIYNWLDKIRKMGLEQSFLVSQRNVYDETKEKEYHEISNKIKKLNDWKY